MTASWHTRSLAANSLRPGDPIRWGLLHATVSYSVGLLLSIVFFSIAGGDAASSTTRVTTHAASLVGLWAGFTIGPLLACRYLGSGSLRDDFGLAIRARDVPIGAMAGVITQLVAVPVASWPIERFLNQDVSGPTRRLLETTTGGRWLLYLLVAAGAPIVEELFFRGMLLRALARRLSDSYAVAASSALFAATHFKPAQFPALFVVGLVFAGLARHFGRLGPAIAAHVAFNTIALVFTA